MRHKDFLIVVYKKNLLSDAFLNQPNLDDEQEIEALNVFLIFGRDRSSNNESSWVPPKTNYPSER